MSPLSTDLRNQLAKAIKDARRVGDAGARNALAALAVDRHEPHGSMASPERRLRNRLRAHGRQLGDRRDPKTGAQEIDRLAHEVAYEHWHRMLFARLLAENHLLIEPESDVAISMAECQELARERDENPWALAGRFAQRMLPRVFRPDDPALEVVMAPETRQSLERLLALLPAAVFTADDSLGWTYQFWQAERKDEVNKSGVRIGADELPAVTQLFTEHYMVQFLFHNTVGAWRAGTILAENPELAERAESEEELRRAVSLDAVGGYDFSYLRFVREARDGDDEGKPTGSWRPAAGAFEGWPRNAADLRVLDPCCGSGHFLVEGFELLVRLRMGEEGLGLEDAIRGVLQDNLFALEIDPRCTQIAAFNLALAAWRLAGRPFGLPALQIACSGLGVTASADEWAKIAPKNQNLQLAMRWLYDEFKNARELGSLLDPSGSSAAKLIPWRDLQPLLGEALEREDVKRDPEAVEVGVAAQGMARAAELLAGAYILVITNVPYLGRGNQTKTLKSFADDNYNEAKPDLATIFVSRIFRWLGTNGTQAVVTPQNWLFLTSYKKLREKLLRLRAWSLVARLGPGAFETVSGHVVNVALSVLSAARPEPEWRMTGIDVSAPAGQRPVLAREKAALLRGETVVPRKVTDDDDPEGSLFVTSQRDQLDNPDSIVSFEHSGGFALFSRVALAYQGVSTGDNQASVIKYWELTLIGAQWAPMQATPATAAPFAGREHLLRRAVLAPGYPAAVRGREAWGREGVAVSQTGRLIPTRYTGEYFSNVIPVIVPHSRDHLAAVWSFCETGELEVALRKMNPKLSVDNGYFGKIEFDLARWQKLAAERSPSGLPEPQSDDPTQWLFSGHPAKAEPQTALQVAVARLLGYRWPAEHNPEMRLAAEARVWVERCRELDALADSGGIVCLMATRGEYNAADRLRRLLAAAYGDDWSAARERELLTAAAGDGQSVTSIEEWLRDRFFEEHCKLFHHRPFVWHVWDGRRDGFHALVSYHRLAGPDGEGRRTLEALTYSYLGDWIARQRAEQREGKEGADARLASALDLQAQLEHILAGEPPFDLFVRWKPLHEQAIGWEPDINDGVRVNIRPFMSADLRTGGRRGAGLLRWKPNIKWGKDRGSEPGSLRPRAEFPWFWGCPGGGTLADRTDFMGGPDQDGNRWNVLHYTNETKRRAREHRNGEGGGP